MNTELHFLERPIEYLKTVGPQRAAMLKSELSIFTFNDLLFYFPFRYEDRSRIDLINQIDESKSYIQVKGVISNIQQEGKHGNSRLSARLYDDTGYINLVWFQGSNWIIDTLKNKKEYVVYGRPSLFNNIISIIHPELSDPLKIELGFTPVYNTTERLRIKNLDSKGISKLMRNLINHPDFSIHENLSEEILFKYNFPDRKIALQKIHFPLNETDAIQARTRLKFEEMFFLQVSVFSSKIKRLEQSTPVRFSKIGALFNTVYSSLPFELTDAQKKVIREIRKSVNNGTQMNRLLQGDVGSGKTVVALLCMLIAADNGYQSCIMAPTEILAQQHYQTLLSLTQAHGIFISLLTGSTSNAQRKRIIEHLLKGETHIIIGTHALIEPDVVFNNLGLCVIDEQHRFGVEQRYRLWKKNINPPHILVMTATPIPRTLSMTLYGDLDVSVIDQLPVGRKSIKTVHRYERNLPDIYKFILEEIQIGHQIYIVYPLIEESEKLDLKSLQEGFENISQHFPPPAFSCDMLHGKMKYMEKEEVMKKYIMGKTNILVSTTVIEVGVNVPNASVMIIMNAERFGLAQLHQLRGRVGRGSEQSYCILVTGEKLGVDARKRMDTMVGTTDGFKIAEVDMELRGPGDITGTKQSGLFELKLVDLITDYKLIEIARNEARNLLEKDPLLKSSKNQIIQRFYQQYLSKKGNWSQVS